MVLTAITGVLPTAEQHLCQAMKRSTLLFVSVMLLLHGTYAQNDTADTASFGRRGKFCSCAAPSPVPLTNGVTQLAAVDGDRSRGSACLSLPLVGTGRECGAALGICRPVRCARLQPAQSASRPRALIYLLPKLIYGNKQLWCAVSPAAGCELVRCPCFAATCSSPILPSLQLSCHKPDSNFAPTAF